MLRTIGSRELRRQIKSGSSETSESNTRSLTQLGPLTLKPLRLLSQLHFVFINLLEVKMLYCLKSHTFQPDRQLDAAEG